MYAIIKRGSKQYRVAEGDVIHIDLADMAKGDTVDFTDILFLYDGKDHRMGEKDIKGFVVLGEILGDTAGEKIRSVKYKKRKRQTKRIGHRQHFHKVRISKIAKQ